MRSVNAFCQKLRENGRKDESVNNCGNTLHRLRSDTDRYIVDFADDFKAEGWMQFDTSQDAHYFGVWVNQQTRTTLSYTEGDWTLVDCPTVESYNAEVESMIACYREGYILKAYGEDGCTTLVQDRSTLLIR